MVRHEYVRRQVLKIYRAMPGIIFPVEPLSIFDGMKNCRVMSYQQMAEVLGDTIAAVVLACESESGCTQYTCDDDRYLTLYNASCDNNNVAGRIRWTLAHELGHIILGHFSDMVVTHMEENNFHSSAVCQKFEKEADFFAATLLSPFPAFQNYEIKSAYGIQSIFGLSDEASRNRMDQYNKWLRTKVKTAWENDMRKAIFGI